MADEHSLAEQVDWLCRAQASRQASMRRHGAEVSKWVAIQQVVSGTAPAWITEEAKRDYLRRVL